MEVVVTGIGLVSALGSLLPSWQRLLAGESAIKICQPFAEIPPLPLAMLGDRPASLNALTEMAVADALQDAGLEAPLADFGIVIGSSRSCQAAWEALAQEQLAHRDAPSKTELGASEKTFANLHQTNNFKLENWLDTLPHQGAIAAAKQIGATGAVLAPMAACATGIWAIAQAFQLVNSGQCQGAIAGAIEAPITPLTLAGFQQMGALARTGCYPFDRQREGLVLGEGGAILVLETAAAAYNRGAKIYGEILGFGLTADACHLNAPDPRGWGAIAAIKQCLERSQLAPNEIDYIHAHGTSTHLNDCHEAQIFQRLFPQSIPISSTKGATGHTLGASGAIGAAFCLMALNQQILPPCVGLTAPEFPLNLLTKAHRSSVERNLCFSFGFGGQNAVIALAKTSRTTTA